MEIQNPEQFRALVKDEAQRLAVREVLEESPSKRTLADHLKHPLVSVLIGFLLTGVAGTLLTHYFQAQEKKALLQRDAHVHIRQFSQSLALRSTEAAYFRSALLRPVEKNVIKQRKESYDVSVKQWNTDLVKNLFTFREYSESRDPIFIERNIENDLVPILRAIDVCLTEEFDHLIVGSTETEKEHLICWVLVNEEEHSVEFSSLLNATRNCGYEISNLLFSWVAVNLKSKDDAWSDNARNVQNTISQRCNSGYTLMNPSANKPLHRTAVALRYAAAADQ